MAVMAAGMHGAGRPGGIGLAGRLGYGQGVHVGAQADDLALVGIAATDDADDAGAPDAGRHLVNAIGFQLFGDGGSRAMNLVENLGVAMDVMAYGDQIVLEVGETVDDGHCKLRRRGGAGSTIARRARGARAFRRPHAPPARDRRWFR